MRSQKVELSKQRTRHLAASIVHKITARAVGDAHSRGASKEELTRLGLAKGAAKQMERVELKAKNELQDAIAEEAVSIPNEGETRSPETGHVTSVETCPKCEKHKYPSCGPTVIASLLGITVDAALQGLEELNGGPLKRDKAHTAFVTDDLMTRAIAEAGFETSEPDFNGQRPRFGAVLEAVLKNRGDCATYIVFVPRHVLLLRTDGAGGFWLLDSGFMFSRTPDRETDARKVKTRKRIRRMIRLYDD